MEKRRVASGMHRVESISIENTNWVLYIGSHGGTVQLDKAEIGFWASGVVGGPFET